MGILEKTQLREQLEVLNKRYEYFIEKDHLPPQNVEERYKKDSLLSRDLVSSLDSLDWSDLRYGNTFFQLE